MSSTKRSASNRCPGATSRSSDDRWRQLGEAALCRLDRCDERRDVQAAVRRSVGAEPPRRLLELPLAAYFVSAPGLVPGDRDVDEALEEVALRRLGRSPGVLEHLVGVVVAAGPDQLEPSRELGAQRIRRRP